MLEFQQQVVGKILKGTRALYLQRLLFLAISTISLMLAHPWYFPNVAPLLGCFGLALIFVFTKNDRPFWAIIQFGLVTLVTFLFWLQWLADSPYLEPLGGVAAFLLALLLAASAIFWRWLLTKINLELASNRLWASLTWCLLEMSREYWFCGFPWYPLGMSFLEVAPGLYGWLGPAGASAVVVWSALEFAYSKNWRFKTIVPTAIFAFFFALSQIQWPIERFIDVQAIILDSQLPVHQFHSSYATDQITSYLYRTMPTIAKRPEAYRFLITPEGLFPDTGSYFCLLANEKARHTEPALLARNFGGYLIMGVEDDWSQLERVTNSLWVFSDRGDLTVCYAKRILVPFAEYFPLSNFSFIGPFLQDLSRSYGILSALNEGIDWGILNLPNLKVALSVCYEETFLSQIWQLRQLGAQLWISSSNDGWFPSAHFKYEHAMHARMNAASLGLPLLRSCQQGITGVIDAMGRWVIWREGISTPAINWVPFEGSLSVVNTPFCWWGPWFIPMLWLLLTSLGVCWLRRIKIGC